MYHSSVVAAGVMYWALVVLRWGATARRWGGAGWVHRTNTYTTPLQGPCPFIQDGRSP